MKRSQRNKILNSQSGSAMLMVLASVALLGIIAYVAATISENVNADAIRARIKENQSNLSQGIQTLIADQNVCLNGLGGSQPGLSFVDSGGNPAAFNLSQVAPAGGGQPVKFGSNFTDLQNQAINLQSSQAGIDLPQFGLTLKRLYVVAVPDASTPNTYTGQLQARVVPTNSQIISLADMTLANISFQINPVTGGVVKCGLANTITSAASLCSSMGCTPNTNSAGATTCQCPLPSMSCPAGSYIQGIDTATMSPICQAITFGCDPATQYLSGVNTDGTPVCVTINSAPVGPAPASVSCYLKCSRPANGAGPLGDYCSNTEYPDLTSCGYPEVTGNPPNSVATKGCMPISCSGAPAPTCPTGTSASNTGGSSNVNGCNCPSGQNWINSSCQAASQTCPAGSSVGGVGIAAGGSGCNCTNAGDTWNGTSCVAPSGTCNPPGYFKNGVCKLCIYSSSAMSGNCSGSGYNFAPPTDGYICGPDINYPPGSLIEVYSDSDCTLGGRWEEFNRSDCVNNKLWGMTCP